MSKGAGGDVTSEWPAKHGVDRADLVSVATPWDNSRCLLMCIKSGPHFGACYLWDHDEPYDLVPFAPTFDIAVKRVMDDFSAGRQPVLSFLDVFVP